MLLLWNEVRDIVQETGIKVIPIEKKCKKAKWLSGEALQIVVKRREAKSKGEKEKYTYLNAEFQRIARRDKKAFLSDQCKEIEENNRMGKTKDLFKKIRDTKGTFYAKMGSIKDRSGMDLTEAEDIKKKWQEYTEELYEKSLHDSDNHDGMALSEAKPTRSKFGVTAEDSPHAARAAMRTRNRTIRMTTGFEGRLTSFCDKVDQIVRRDGAAILAKPAGTCAGQ